MAPPGGGGGKREGQERGEGQDGYMVSNVKLVSTQATVGIPQHKSLQKSMQNMRPVSHQTHIL